METLRLRYDAGPEGARALAHAARLLRAGRLVAFPTETVYGLGALATDASAVRKIFTAKGRPQSNPLIVHVADEAAAHQVAAAWPERAARLAARFWPGALTLVLPRAPGIPAIVSAGLSTIAVRVPAHPVAQALLREVGEPIAAPSANRYTAVSPTTAEHVQKSLGGRIDAILDGGATPVGIESTVLDLSGDRPTLLRPGSVLREEIEEVIGAVDEREGLTAMEGEARSSPGLSRRHYAPDARVRLLPPEAIEGFLRNLDETAGVLSRFPKPPGVEAAWVQLPGDAEGFARQLYGALHSLEDLGVRWVVLEELPPGPEWAGLRDRLARAGG